MKDFTQRDLVIYILYSYKEIEKYSEKTLDNYIDKLRNHIRNTNIEDIFNLINLSLLDNFEFRARLNYLERISYAKLIYRELLARIDKTFSDEDVIKKTINIYHRFSGRTAIEEVTKLGL